MRLILVTRFILYSALTGSAGHFWCFISNGTAALWPFESIPILFFLYHGRIFNRTVPPNRMWCSFPGETLYFFSTAQIRVGKPGPVLNHCFSNYATILPGGFTYRVSLRSIAIIYGDGRIILPSALRFYTNWRRIELRSLIFTRSHTRWWWSPSEGRNGNPLWSSFSTPRSTPVEGSRQSISSSDSGTGGKLFADDTLRHSRASQLSRGRCGSRMQGCKRKRWKKNAKLITSSVLWVRWDNL